MAGNRQDGRRQASDRGAPSARRQTPDRGAPSERRQTPDRGAPNARRQTSDRGAPNARRQAFDRGAPSERRQTPDRGAPSARRQTPDRGAPAPQRHQGQYTIYKPVKSGKGGAIRFELSTERGAVFVEGAHQEEGQLRRFKWQTKIVMKWGLSDLGEALAVFERRQTEANRFHKNEKGNTAFEIKFQSDRKPANYFLTISRQRGDTKAVDRLGISLSPGEGAVLAALFRQAVVLLSGWDS